MPSNLNHTWAPPQSRVRIEYPIDLLKQIRSERRRRDVEGVLYGVRCENNIRVMAAGRWHGAGLEPVGIFAARTRGRVFLTESDLARLETIDGVALVVAGASAGFFVRELDGSIQSIQSYQEFGFPAEAPSRKSAWTWIALESLVVLALPFVWLPARSAESLTIRAEPRQLQVSWNPGTPGKLEILDGGHSTTVPVPADLASLTYVPRTGNVEIRLIRSKPEP